MRIIQTVKQLKEWQLTQQDSGKTWALLPFLNGLPRESNALLHGARIRCDLVLTVLDGNSENNRTALNSLSDSDCDAVLLLDAELNRPCGDGLSLQFAEPYPELVRTPHYQRLGLQLLRLFSLLRPQMAIFSLQDLPQYWLANRINEECFLPVNITAAAPVPTPTNDAQEQLLHTVLQRCAQAISAGQDVVGALQRGRQILESRGYSIRYFDCYDIFTLIHTTKAGADAILWAQLDNNIQSSHSVRLGT